MVRLRRLERRLQQLVRDPGHTRLRDICFRNWQDLAGSFALPLDVDYFTLEQHCPLLVQCIDTVSQEERQVRLQLWNNSVKDSPSKQSAWVKRKTAQVLQADHGNGQVSSSVWAQQTAVRPVQQILQAQQTRLQILRWVRISTWLIFRCS